MPSSRSRRITRAVSGRLELWASDHPYEEGALTGQKVAEIAVGLPTPLGPYLHRVEAQAPAQLPLQGRAYAMVLALVRA